MSNIAFNKGDYLKQLDITNPNGLIYFNLDNRDIAIGNTDNNFVNMNQMMINDNEEISDLNTYTNTNKYLSEHKIPISLYNDTNEYYTAENARTIIGDTDDTMTNGYVKNILNTIIHGTPYEAQFKYEGTETRVTPSDVNNRYTVDVFTIYYPNIAHNQHFNLLIIFFYTDNKLSTSIHNVESQEDVTITTFRNSDILFGSDISTSIYKAFWV